MRIMRHCGLAVLAGVLSLGLAAPALAAGYGAAPATTGVNARQRARRRA